MCLHTYMSVCSIIHQFTCCGLMVGKAAEEAIQAGCSAVWVSNHGGRQLDGVYSGVIIHQTK